MAANLILCCMRGGDNRDENMETVSAAEEFFGRGVCGLDLAGAEALFPTGNFEDVLSWLEKKIFLLPSMPGKPTDRKASGKPLNSGQSVSVTVSGA